MMFSATLEGAIVTAAKKHAKAFSVMPLKQEGKETKPRRKSKTVNVSSRCVYRRRRARRARLPAASELLPFCFKST